MDGGNAMRVRADDSARQGQVRAVRRYAPASAGDSARLRKMTKQRERDKQGGSIFVSVRNGSG